MSKQADDWGGLAAGIVNGAANGVAGAHAIDTGTRHHQPRRERLEALCRELLRELGGSRARRTHRYPTALGQLVDGVHRV